ncbi:hypothetical protein M9M90_09625 [Phenylobacterium sp. LH3H17]|uniref:hypothetical protein n=1 Tax=Phenylobacterium sp. LH3H17 TaxID=2903901 RepID=UPI0020C9616D|nr:hypothetical protein [Phenylobacterium sp. LH3H17]UTP41411.1 hypothetical protein M9M90_09625 [Phenylobacterium sp. LH3H17]
MVFAAIALGVLLGTGLLGWLIRVHTRHRAPRFKGAVAIVNVATGVAAILVLLPGFVVGGNFGGAIAAGAAEAMGWSMLFVVPLGIALGVTIGITLPVLAVFVLLRLVLLVSDRAQAR